MLRITHEIIRSFWLSCYMYSTGISVMSIFVIFFVLASTSGKCYNVLFLDELLIIIYFKLITYWNLRYPLSIYYFMSKFYDISAVTFKCTNNYEKVKNTPLILENTLQMWVSRNYFLFPGEWHFEIWILHQIYIFEE